MKKYYESTNGKRWVIYADTIDASKIPVEWFSWIHYTKNKIEKDHNLEKYSWQKPHQSNLTGTDEAYYPNKNKNGNKKKYSSWKEIAKNEKIIKFKNKLKLPLFNSLSLLAYLEKSPKLTIIIEKYAKKVPVTESKAIKFSLL